MFRVLCLDGGGIKGVFAAAALAQIEKQAQARIIDHFDLIVGTSTGGILAIGLGMGYSAHDLLKFYCERGPVIFPATVLVQHAGAWVRQLLWGPKLSHKVLRAELERLLGGRTLGEARCRLVIPSYDAVGARIYIFKTAHASEAAHDAAVPAVDVALATSAAPTYFAAANTKTGGRFVDGGVWANSPVMVAIAEAVAFLGVPLHDIDILSIGTTSRPFNIARHAKASALRWNVRLIDLMVEAQVEASQAQAKLFCPGRVHRIDFIAPEGRFSLDDARPQALFDLANLGANEVNKRVNREYIRERFMNGKRVAPFEPIAHPSL